MTFIIQNSRLLEAQSTHAPKTSAGARVCSVVFVERISMRATLPRVRERRPARGRRRRVKLFRKESQFGTMQYSDPISEQYTGLHQYTGRRAGASQYALIRNVAPVAPDLAARKVVCTVGSHRRTEQQTSLVSLFCPLSFRNAL